MSKYKSCVWKPLTGTSRSALRKDILCFHTMVGYLNSTWSYFNRPDVAVYSHIGIGGIWGSDKNAKLDGVAWQMADTNYRAAANLDGNYRIISVETADNAARPIAPWTPNQCDKIVQIMVDAHMQDGIPLVLVPDSKPGRRGVAYHRLGCNPYRTSGGELWSGAYGKDCPTDPRIRQLPALLDRAKDIVAGNPEGLLMALSEAEQNEVLKAARQINGTVVFGQLSFEGTMESMANRVNQLVTAVATLQTSVREHAQITGDDETHLLARFDVASKELAATQAALEAKLDEEHPEPPATS